MERLHDLTSPNVVPSVKISSVVICAVVSESGKVLLLQRADETTEGFERWQAPEGKIILGQTARHIKNAVRNRVKAATGLDVIGLSSDVYRDARIPATSDLGMDDTLCYEHYAGVQVDRSAPITLSDKYTDYTWETWSEIQRNPAVRSIMCRTVSCLETLHHHEDGLI